MDRDIVENYIWTTLKKQLQKLKTDNRIMYKIIDDIKKHLYSMISIWNNEELRNAILIIGSEEGNFYEPKNEIIANMVVVTIRNSLLEEIASNNYTHYGESQYISPDNMKEITSKAIEYFSKYDLSKIKVKYNSFYQDVCDKYPVAVKALKELSKCTENEREHEYKNIADIPYEIKEIELNNIGIKEKYVTESGISEEFDSTLCSYLMDIKNGSKYFICDSFKMTTRNIQKLLRIIEFILTHDAMFITSNYLLKKDYVSRRKKILRASHDIEEFYKKVQTINEISNKYENELLDISKM